MRNFLAILWIGALGAACSSERQQPGVQGIAPVSKEIDAPEKRPEQPESGTGRGTGADPRTQQATQTQPGLRVGAPDGLAQLAAAQPVDGHVVHPSGAPLAGARVTLFRRLRDWPRRDREKIESVRSGKGGRFVFKTSRARGLDVEVQAPGCATLIRAAPGPGLGPLVLRLGHGFKVAGRVSMPNGRPAAGCEVHLEPGVGSRMRAVRGSTDRKGRFRFHGVPAENLRLTARHEKFQPVSVNTVSVGRLIHLKFEDTRLGVSGTVVAADSGDAVSGGEVHVYPRTPNGALYVPFTAKTDRKGEFTILGLGPGSYEIEVRHEDYSANQRALSLNRSRTGLQIELPRRVKAKGRLVMADATSAARLEGARLTLVSYYGEIADTRVGPNGEFEFSDAFSRGMGTLELDPGPYCFRVGQSRWLRQMLDDDAEDMRLKVERASVVAGSVLDETGTPIPGVAVTAALNQWSDPGLLATRKRVLAVTDETGSYEIRGLPPGEICLGFQKETFAYNQKIARVDNEHADAKTGLGKPNRGEVVKLLRPASISGRVTRGGSPVAGALVFVGGGLSRVAREFTDRRGRYTLRGLPEGSHLVRVKFSTILIAHSEQAIDVKAGQHVTGIDIPLPIGRRIEGRVVDSEELPMANVFVESRAGTSTNTDESGRFVIDVPPGRSYLFVRVTKSDPSFDRVLVDGKIKDLVVRMRLAPRAGVRAKVTGLPKDVPVDGVVLRLDTDHERVKVSPLTPTQSLMNTVRILQQYQEFNRLHVRGDVERWVETPGGLLEANNLPAGVYNLTLHAKGYQPFIKRVTLFDGKPLDLRDVKLQKGAMVRGVVVDPGGKAVPGARIVLGRESDLTLSGARTHYRADSKGQFTVEGVGLDLKLLYVAAKGYATHAHELELPRDILSERLIRVQMQQGATIKAALTDSSGDPVPFRMVQLNRGYERIAERETDEDGVAWFHNLSEGTYHVYLRGKVRSIKAQTIRDTRGAKVYPVKLVDKPRRR